MPAVQLRTARSWLRPFAPGDVDALHAIFTTPDVRRYLLDDEVMPRSWVEAVVTQSETDFRSSAGLWSLALAEGGPPVGFTGYREFHEPPVRELIWGVAPGHQGRGLAFEASRAALRYGFEALGLDPIRATADAPNEASIRLAHRLGMTETGREPGPLYEQVHFALARAAFTPDPGLYRVLPI